MRFDFWFLSFWKKTTILFLLIIFGFGLSAQPKFSYSSVKFDKFTKFTNYYNRDGICSYNFTDIIQDRDGFMWIGTMEGLMRFDGYTFTTFIAGEDKNDLPSSYIYSLAVDSVGGLWVGTRAGLCKYKPETNEFERIAQFFGIDFPSSDSWIMKLYFDKKNRLWIDSYGGILSCVDFNRETLKSYQHNFVENLVYNFHYINEVEGGLLVGGATSVLSYFNFETESFEMINPQIENYEILFQQGFSDSYDIGEGKVWLFSFSGKAVCFNKKNFELTYLPFTSVYTVAPNGMGELWMGGYSNGARLYNPTSKSKVVYLHDENNPYSLAGNQVRKIYRDRQGNFWFGTNGGLSVLTKKLNRFEHIRKIPEKNSLPTNDVTALLSTNFNELWVGTRSKGLVRYDQSSSYFSTHSYFNSPDSIGSNFVTSISQYDANNLYLSLWNGWGGALNRYSIGRNSFSRFQFDDNYFWYRSVLVHSSKRVLVGSWGTGVHEFDVGTQNYTSTFINVGLNPHIFGNSSFTISCNSAGWVHFWGSGFTMNTISGDSLVIFSEGVKRNKKTFKTRCIEYPLVNGEMLINLKIVGDEAYMLYPNGGVARANLPKRTFSVIYNNPTTNFTNLFIDSLLYLAKKNKLYRWDEKTEKPELILADSSLANISTCSAIDGNRMFVGTSTGLFIAAKEENSTWKVEKKIYNGQVNSIIKASENKYVATLTGLLKVDSKGNVLQVFFRNRSVIAATLDSASNIWVALDKGLYWLNCENDSITAQTPNPKSKHGLPSDKVYSLATDANGNVWLSTDIITATYNPKTKLYTSFYEPYRKSLSSGLVYDLFEDSQGYVWVCYTDKLGIDRIDLKSRNVKHFNNLPYDSLSFPKTTAYCIRELSDGTIAVATDVGLALMHGRENRFTIITAEDGFPSNHITSIAEDDSGDIWLGSTAGFFKYNRANKSVQTFTLADGMQEGTISTIIPLNEGKLAVGGAGGINIIDPESTTIDTASVHVRVTRCLVDTDIEYFNLYNNQQIVLEPDTKTIQFEFSALDYGSPTSVKYSYILEGFDDTLVSTSSDFRVAKYSNLPPGNYLLKITATNADGIWSSNPFSIKILVKKPFYLKIWFLFLALAVVCGVVYLIIKWREKWLRSENVRLDRIVLERTAEVTQQNEEIRAQRDIIASQSEEIKQVNLHLTDSIEYALSLQSAMMPTEPELSEILGEHFLVFKPKDIVSGDFYWIKGTPEQFTLVLADCTGHGVHGGFMSMLGMSFVSETYETQSNPNPYAIVNGIHKHFAEAIMMSADRKLITTGMDIGVCLVDREKGTMQFSGTRLPLYIIRKNGDNAELIKFKSGKKPVGSPWFTNDIPMHEIEIFRGDEICISTDGAFDQLSKVERKRFNRAQFEELLVKVSNKTFEEQGRIIDEKLTAWQGGGVQTDDISVLGFRI